MIQADTNGQEVQTPQDDHGQAEETVAGSHDVNREPYKASEQANIDALSM
ncbi:hypothetical protein GCM10020255_045760 [Rhodococcus baikonurensis]